MQEIGKGKSSPKKKEEKKEEIKLEAPSLKDLAKQDLEEYADEIQGPDVLITETDQEDHAYLKEGSPEQEDVLKDAAKVDKKFIVMNDYGSSEWRLITSSINEKIGYRTYTHAMPLGSTGQKGVLIKTLTIQQGNCSVHTVYSPTLRTEKDPKAANLFILK